MDYHYLQNSLYQNAAMGITALRQVIPAVRDSGMKEILLKQYKGYKTQTELTSAQMKSRGMTPEEPSASAKLMARASAAMKLRRDSSSENIAKMLIKGTNTGIIELTEKLNKTTSDFPEAVTSAKEYLRREQSYIESLKPYL
ncbi:MAG: hypothetical protein K2K57_03645 [Oscillospiraceae bacterium]|nr:hypothetical protein [Oscillospiraceae bacterium]